MFRKATLPILIVLASLAQPVCSRAAEEKSLDADPHLAGWWKFDDAAGTTAADSSKHGRDGLLAGGVSFDENSVPGRIGKALSLGGGDDLVTMAGYKGVAGPGPRTVAAWIKCKATQGEIVSWGKKDFGQMWILGFIRRHVGVTPSGGYFYMADQVNDDNWHHVAVVVREADEPNLHDDVILYLDGEIAEIDDIGLLDLWPINTGSERDVTVGQGFQGAVDELRIYDRALSDEEIAALHGLAK